MCAFRFLLLRLGLGYQHGEVLLADPAHHPVFIQFCDHLHERSKPGFVFPQLCAGFLQAFPLRIFNSLPEAGGDVLAVHRGSVGVLKTLKNARPSRFLRGGRALFGLSAAGQALRLFFR